MSRDSDETRRALAFLKSRDHQYTVFGSESHRYELRPRLEEAKVAEFEERYGIRLPADYRRFLIQVGNGGAGPFYGVLGLDQLYEVEEEFWGDLSKPFPYSQPCEGDPALLDALRQAEECEDDERREELVNLYWTTMTHDGAIIVCEYGCCLRLLLVVNGDEYGNVWFDQTADLAGYRPVGINGNAPAEPYANWCLTHDSPSPSTRVTFGEWYDCWLDWACRLVEHSVS